MKKFTSNLLFLILICICISPVVAAVNDTAIITMTNKDVTYQIKYSNDTANVTLTEYQMTTNTDLAGVQQWFVKGSNDGSNWTLLDTRTNISFVNGVTQTFTITTPDIYQYYELRLKKGFYKGGQQITLTLTTNQNSVISPTPPAIVGPHGVIDNDYYITMTNTRVLYKIDYGNTAANITLIYYKAFADVTLVPVQSWEIYGSNDNTGWSLIDDQQDISISIDSSRIFTVATPKPYRYYLIYLNGGYYNLGQTAVFIFTTDQNGNGQIIPTPTPTPTGTPTPYPTQVEGEQTSRIRAEIGETYIKWSWDQVSQPLNIYTNDTIVPAEMGYTGNSYLQTGLNAGEMHTIALYTTNGTQLVARAEATTTMQSEIIYILLGLCFVVFVILLFVKNGYIFIILSIFNIILSIFGASQASGHGMLPYVFFGIAIITAIVLLIQGLPKLREQIDWL